MMEDKISDPKQSFHISEAADMDIYDSLAEIVGASDSSRTISIATGVTTNYTFDISEQSPDNNSCAHIGITKDEENIEESSSRIETDDVRKTFKPNNDSSIDKSDTTNAQNNQDGRIQELNEDSEQSRSDRHLKNSTPQLETLNCLRNFLLNYEPTDELDQDTIETTILNMNKSAFIRCRLIDIVTSKRDFQYPDPTGNEQCWDDNDFYPAENEKPNFLRSLVNVVTPDFFYDVIDTVEAGTTDFLLNEDAIKMVRDSLSIRDGGKKRKRRDLRVKLPTSPEGSNPYILGDTEAKSRVPATVPIDKKMGETCHNEINGRRRTRGMTRGSRSMCLDEHKSSQHKGLEILLGAMIEYENAVGAPIDLLEEITQQRKLRTRNKAQKPAPLEANEEGHFRKLRDAKGREITKVIVGGKTFASPTRRGPKRKIISLIEDKVKRKRELSHILLDWNSRLPLKNKKKVASRALPTTSTHTTKSRKMEKEFPFTEGNIDAIIASWEALDSTNGLSEESATMEPCRARYSDKIYGRWCRNLLNCLQGSARVFARHEFFYSDIDRAWFNSNPFHKDLEAHDIDPQLQLTRKEWSTIRRRVRKKPPRRFSRSFIYKEFVKLNNYRKEVRDIQKQIHFGCKLKRRNFEFEVLAPSQIGTTVTAYHHTAHLLHRGIVLCHDYKTEAYLIQFEKRSLGYEWCADFEVASHGLQRVIYPPEDDVPNQNEYLHNNSPRVCLPSRTDYGPLIEFYKKEAPCVGAPIDVTSEKYSYFKKDMKNVVRKIEEREGLVKLMCEIELILERKEALLLAMKKYGKVFNHAPDDCNRSNRVQVEKEQARIQLQEHFMWLHSNLKITNRALDIALAQLQIIYGKGYTGLKKLPHFHEKAATSGIPNGTECNLVKTDSSGYHNCPAYSQATDDLAFEIGSEISTRVLSSDPASASIGSNSYTSGMLASAGGLLVISDVLTELFKTNKQISTTLDTRIIKEALDQLRPEPICLPEEADCLLRSRQDAFTNLTESVNMLLAELTSTETSSL